MPPLSLQQLENRKNSIGGSDAAVAIGISPYRTPLDLYFEKTGLKEPEDISDVNAVYWGNRLEDIVAEEYARRTGHTIEVEAGTLTHPTHSFMTAHLDRRVIDPTRILECKTANAYLEKEWGDPISDEIPLAYIVQVQHCLAVDNSQDADIAVLIGGQDYRIYELKRDEELITDLIRAENVFWQRVLNLDPPDPINNNDLKLIYGYDNGTMIETTKDVTDAWRSLKKIKQEIKSLEQQQEEMEFQIKKYMGDHSTLTHINKGKFMATWKTQKNNRFQIHDFQIDHPKLTNEYTKNKPSRVLRLKKGV